MRTRTARALSACAVMLLATLAACSNGDDPASGALTPTLSPAPSATATVTVPSPSVSPSLQISLSPSPSKPASSSPKPPASASPKPSSAPKPPAGPISCTGTAELNRPQAGGTGPGGSMMSTGGPGVALTFDDGPDPVNTPLILDELKQCGVKATFCVVGFRARDYPDMVRRIVAEGHTLCNHSWQHLTDLAKRDDAYILKDLNATNWYIRKAVPGAAIAYFRAPGGNFDANLVKLASGLGMKSIYWHVDPRDWDSATYGTGAKMQTHVIGEIEKSVRPGSIILSHDNKKPDTIAAYRTLLPWLKARFTLIPLPVSPSP